MIIRKSDLTNEAQDLGIWNTLLELAGVMITEDDDDDQEIEITSVKQIKNHRKIPS